MTSIPDEDAVRDLVFKIVFEPPNCFIDVEGVGRIAKRENCKWIALIPGWSVFSSIDDDEINITYRPIARRRTHRLSRYQPKKIKR